MLSCLPEKAIGQQSDWYVQSPLPAQVVEDGELFVSVEISGEVPLDESSVAVTLDGYDVTRMARITPSSVRLLYTSKLGGGRHDVIVSGALMSGEKLSELAWHFVIEGDPSSDGPARPLASRVADFRGKTLIDTRNSDISGDRDLRQEPTHSYAVRADAEGLYGAFTFPVKLYLTTDESSIAQPRNRFMLGVEGPMFAAYAGDYNPRISPLLLNGARTRGFHGEFHGLGFHLETAIGTLRRGLEGRVLDTPIEQPQRQLPGTFQRRLKAIKVGFGHEESVLFSVSGLKAKDDTSSIALGNSPLENIVLGSDLTTRLLDGRLRFETGGAISVTTHDIGRGAATKADIDSLFNTDIPVDPADFDWLITLNTSTVPLRLDHLTSTAWYFGTKVIVPGHTVDAEIRTVGTAYYSAANPFLQADRRTLTISDRFRIDRGRFSGTVRYQNYGSLSDGGDRLKLTSNLVEGRVNVALRPDLPRFVTGLRMQWRERGTDPTDPVASDLRVSTASLGVVHTLETGPVRHALNLFYTRTARRDEIKTIFDNTTHALSLGASESFPKSIRTNVQFTHLVVNYAGDLDRQRWTSIAGTVGYRFYQDAADVAITLRTTHAGATTFSVGSDRIGFILSSSVRLQGNMTMELQAGYNDYWEEADNGNQYTERYVRLRHRYTF